MKAGDRPRKRARRGFKGYPIATVAFYGSDDRLAKKTVVSIVRQEDAYPDELERWLPAGGDTSVAISARRRSDGSDFVLDGIPILRPGDF